MTASPLQMAQAYATFANGGEMNTAYFITKIENASGDIIATHSKKSKRIISQSVANQMTSMMLGTFSNGSAVNANYTGYTMAGKTGTAQQSEIHPDHVLFVGFAPAENPEIAVAVRIANGYSSAYTAEIGRDIVKSYYKISDSDKLVTGKAAQLGAVTAGD